MLIGGPQYVWLSKPLMCRDEARLYIQMAIRDIATTEIVEFTDRPLAWGDDARPWGDDARAAMEELRAAATAWFQAKGGADNIAEA